MKKLTKIICVAVMALFAMPQSADAQFFKKLKEAAKSVVKDAVKTDADGNKSTAAKAAPSLEFVTSADGVSIGNPGTEHFDLQFVEAVGNKASNTVTVYVKAAAKKLNYNNAHIGGRNQNVKAYDADGNEYETVSYGEAKTLTVGLPVKFELGKFAKVPATVESFAVIYSGWYLDTEARCPGGTAYMQYAIQLKNVPIKWQ